MKRALCIAVSIAVMVVFSFADVMAVTKAPDEGTNPDATVPEAIATEEPAEEASDDVVVGEPSEEETDADAEESAVTAKAIESVTLTAKAGDGTVDLTWEYKGDVTNPEKVTFAVYMGDAVIAGAEALTDLSYPVTGLTNGTPYTFKVGATEEGQETVFSDPITVTPEAPVVSVGNVGKVTSGSDFASVNLTWKTVEGADGYIVHRYDNNMDLYNDQNTLNTGQLKEVIVDNNAGTVTWRVRAMERKGTSLATYKFGVMAFKYKDPNNKNMNNIVTSPQWKVIDNCMPVRAMYATFTPKKTGYAYKSAKGKKKGMKLKKGKKYIAKGFVCSRYRVCKDSNSAKVYFYPRVLGKGGKFLYSKSIKYTPKEAENFVNHRGLKSKGKGKNTLVWISLYTQHVYFFKGSQGHWKHIDDWEVSTGKLQSATATGDWKIFRHWKNRRGLSYWSNFYSQVAMHSWGNPKCFGVPHSGGCVRMTKKQAKWVYNNMPFGTTVTVY